MEGKWLSFEEAINIAKLDNVKSTLRKAYEKVMDSEPNKMIIYGFALGNTGKLLHRLQNLDCRYLVFPNNLGMYLEMLIHDQPLYILGLGSYSGIDQDKIRIETTCSNQFRNNIDGNIYTEVEIRPFLKPTKVMKYTKAIGNSYCNQISWKITQLIGQGKLHSRYTFLRIPKTVQPWRIGSEIDQALRSFSQS